MFASMMLFTEMTQPTTTTAATSPSSGALPERKTKPVDDENARRGNHVRSKTRNGSSTKKSYEAEYKQLERAELEDMLSGELPDFSSGQTRWNERKNRYSNNLPLESTRVKLAPRPHLPGSDYINANYIRAPTPATACQPNEGTLAVAGQAESCSDSARVAEYIAAQAPLTGTCGDFWRMVAEQGARLVVMLTRLREGERTKAARYWPRRVGHVTQFGEVLVRLVSAHSHYGPARDDLIVRRFLIRRLRVGPQADHEQQKQHDDDMEYSDDVPADSEGSEAESSEESSNGEWQEVVHLHYQAWPDFGLPEADSFGELLRLVDSLRAGTPHAPVVTHCSAGLGRTGVLIAAHISLSHLRLGGVRPDVWDVVRHIRKQRPGMVQTIEQFAFIHEVVDTLLAERVAAHSNGRKSERAVASVPTTRRSASSPPTISAGKPCCSAALRGRASASGSSLGTAASSSPSCCSFSFDDLMDFDIIATTATNDVDQRQQQQQQQQQQRRGRQSLCSSTPAICMRA